MKVLTVKKTIGAPGFRHTFAATGRKSVGRAFSGQKLVIGFYLATLTATFFYHNPVVTAVGLSLLCR